MAVPSGRSSGRPSVEPEKRKGCRLTTNVDQSVLGRLNKLAALTGKDKAVLLREAIFEFLARHEEINDFE